MSLEFPVTISNQSGPETSLAEVAITVVNRSRGRQLARNVRPNAQHPYPNVRIPAGGTLTVAAGVTYHPPPPAADDVIVEVTVRLTDGRITSRTGAVAAPGS